MLQLTRRYLRQIDGIFLALCAACSVLSVVTLVSIGHNQLGSINKASVQFIASALGILLALIVSTVDYRALARAWPLHAVLAWGMVLPTLLLHNVRLGFLTVGYDAGGTSNYSWYRVGGMTFQPAELAKISFVLTLALHLNHVRGRVNKPANLLALAVHVLLPVLAIARGVLHYAEQGCNHFIAFKLLALIRDKVFGALRRLTPAKLEGRDRGDLISLITADIEALEVFYAHTISPICIACICVIGMTGFVGSWHILPALVLLAGYLLVGVALPVWSGAAPCRPGVPSGTGRYQQLCAGKPAGPEGYPAVSGHRSPCRGHHGPQ